MSELSLTRDARAALALDLSDLKRLRAEIGEMPPSPATWRGRLGAVLVRVLRRALFWVWPPFRALFTVLCRILERLSKMLMDLEDRSPEPSSDGASFELVDLQARLKQVEDAQADAWLQVTKLRAEVSELRSSSVRKSVVR